MKVLMISGDPGVQDPNTEAGKRTEEYRQVLGTLDILVCRGSIWSFALGFFRGLKMMRRGYDIITAQDMEHSFLAWLFSKIYVIPWQMQIHTDIFSPYFVQHSVLNRMRVLIAKFLLSRADCIRVVSERIKNSIDTWRFNRQVAVKPPITVLPVFVDIEKINNAPIKIDLHQKYGKDKFIILMASRITKEKNIALAVEAAAQVFQDLAQSDGTSRAIPQQRDMRVLEKLGAEARPILLIVGDGPEKQNLESRIKNLELQNSVTFEPYTNDLASYYKTCDLFLLTSNYEGYGRTLIEAAATCAKIVSSDVGIASEILEPECIFKVGDKEDLKQKLISALENKLPAPRLLAFPNKEEYLKLYRNGFEICLKNQKNRK